MLISTESGDEAFQLVPGIGVAGGAYGISTDLEEAENILRGQWVPENDRSSFQLGLD